MGPSRDVGSAKVVVGFSPFGGGFFERCPRAFGRGDELKLGSALGAPCDGIPNPLNVFPPSDGHVGEEEGEEEQEEMGPEVDVGGGGGLVEGRGLAGVQILAAGDGGDFAEEGFVYGAEAGFGRRIVDEAGGDHLGA